MERDEDIDPHKNSKALLTMLPEEMLQEYLKATDLLTINEENRLRRQVEELTIKRSEMDEFRAELDSLNGILKG